MFLIVTKLCLHEMSRIQFTVLVNFFNCYDLKRHWFITHETIDRAFTWKFPLWNKLLLNELYFSHVCVRMCSSVFVYVRLLCFNWEIDLNENENICSNNLIISFYRGNWQISRNNKKLTSTNVNELNRISQNLLFFQ